MNIIHMNCINQMIQTFFHSMNQENMIYLQKHLKKTKEAEHMAYFQVNWNKYTDQLSKIVDKKNGQITHIQIMEFLQII